MAHEQKKFSRWSIIAGLLVAVFSIIGSVAAFATWIGAKIDAPANAVRISLEPRVTIIETNQAQFLKSSDFKEFTKQYWDMKKNDAVTQQNIAVAVGKIETAVENIQGQQAELRSEVQSLKR